MDTREVTIRVGYSDITLTFTADLDHLNRNVYSVVAWCGDQRYWSETYNRDYDTKLKFDAAFNRYNSRAISC